MILQVSQVLLEVSMSSQFLLYQISRIRLLLRNHRDWRLLLIYWLGRLCIG